MTPLKPIENLKVRGAPHGPLEYPLPELCQHPDCTEKATNQHEMWPKSMLKGKFWYVSLEDDPMFLRPIPNVIHLCGSGTTGHHGEVEAHAAWIKYEEGAFNWYERGDYDSDDWKLLGPLNPQPGHVEGKPKRKRFKGEARRKRATISIRVPQDAQEDGGAVWDELMELVKEKLVKSGLIDAEKDVPPYPLIVAALYDWLNS